MVQRSDEITVLFINIPTFWNYAKTACWSNHQHFVGFYQLLLKVEMTANVGNTNHPQFDNKMVVYGGLWWFMVVYGIALPTDVLGAEKKPVKSGVKIPPSQDQKRPKRRCFCRVALRHDGAMGGCVGGWGCDAEKKWRSSQCLTCQKWGIWYHLIILYLL